MYDLDPYIGAAIFFSSFFLDLIAARYTYYVVSLHAERAAALSFLWHMVSAVVVIQYAQNAVYIVFVCLGGGLGTYFTIWAKRRLAGASWVGSARVAEAAVVITPPLRRAAAPAAKNPLSAAEPLAGLIRANETRHPALVGELAGRRHGAHEFIEIAHPASLPAPRGLSTAEALSAAR